MRSPVQLVWSSALALALAGCESSCSFSTARLSDIQVARSVDPSSQAPIDPVSTFGPDTAQVFVTARLESAPTDTKIKATFHYLEGGEQQIAEDEVTASGSRFVSFTLTGPPSGWPPGQYQARLWLDGKEAGRAPFNVTGAAPAPAGGQASAGTSGGEAGGEWKLFRDERHGIQFELPASWAWRAVDGKAYFIEGPKGSEDFELTVVSQVVRKEANAGSSAIAQAGEALQQLLKAPDAELRGQKSVTVAGQEAPLVIVTYTARDSRQQALTFGHLQVVLDHGDFYYWLSYSGPAAIYDRRMPLFEHMLGTVRLGG